MSARDDGPDVAAFRLADALVGGVWRPMVARRTGNVGDVQFASGQPWQSAPIGCYHGSGVGWQTADRQRVKFHHGL